MNTEAEFVFDGHVIDLTARDIAEDVHHGGYEGKAIAAAAEHAVRIGHADVDVLTELLNRDYHDMTLPGMPSDMRPGQTRKYVVADLERITRTARFKSLTRQGRDAAAAAAKRQARREREEREAAERTQRAFDAEVALIPNVFAALNERIAELEAALKAR